ncbi:hypothetical protein BGW42_007537, partial [Actinomortierella wolfii]
EPEQSAAPESKNKKKVKTTKVNRASRSQRDAAERQRRMAQALAQGTELKIQQRSRGLGQVINDGLKGLCETVTLSKGDTRHLLNTYMASNLQPAVEAFVAAGLASEFRRHLLTTRQHFVDTFYMQCKWTSWTPLLNYQNFPRIFRLKKTRVNDESALAREIAVKFEEDYAHIAQPVLERIRAFLDGTIHLSVIEEIARHVSDRIRTQTHHYVNTLKTRFSQKKAA